MLSFKPVEAVVCSGGGIQANLADRLREARVPMHIVRDAGAQNEAPPARSKAPAQAERGGAKRTANGDDLPPF